MDKVVLHDNLLFLLDNEHEIPSDLYMCILKNTQTLRPCTSPVIEHIAPLIFDIFGIKIDWCYGLDWIDDSTACAQLLTPLYYAKSGDDYYISVLKTCDGFDMHNLLLAI